MSAKAETETSHFKAESWNLKAEIDGNDY